MATKSETCNEAIPAPSQSNTKPASKSASQIASKPVSRPDSKPATQPDADSSSRPKSKPSSRAKRAAPPTRPSGLASKRARIIDDIHEPGTSEDDVRRTRSAARPKASSVAEPEPAVRKSRTAKLAPTKTMGRAQRRAETLPTISEVKLEESELHFRPIATHPGHYRPTALMFVWGSGEMGQFGMGPEHLDSFDRPTRHKLVEEMIAEGKFGGKGAGIESIASGGLHTLFIDEVGKVWSCGVNDDAALGRETTVVSPETGKPVQDDQLLSVPHPIQSLVDEGFRAVKVTAGDSICAAISDKGELRVWGSFRSAEGPLGFSSKARNQFDPVPVKINLSRKPGHKEKISDIVAGDNHLLVLSTHGLLYSWGTGEQGQLGRRIMMRRKIMGTSPDKVVLGKRAKNRAVAIGAGAMTSYAVDEEGVLWAWGLNNLGQTGTGSEETEIQVPTRVVGMSSSELPDGATVVAMAGGEHHSVFLTSDGHVYACGRANAGQIGLPKNDKVFVDRGDDRDHLRVPVLVPFPDMDDPVVSISCGVHCTAAVTKGGALLLWGQGASGELGIKGKDEVWEPTVVVRKEGGKWKALSVSCGGQHAIGLFASKDE